MNALAALVILMATLSAGPASAGPPAAAAAVAASSVGRGGRGAAPTEVMYERRVIDGIVWCSTGRLRWKSPVPTCRIEDYGTVARERAPRTPVSAIKE